MADDEKKPAKRLDEYTEKELERMGADQVERVRRAEQDEEAAALVDSPEGKKLLAHLGEANAVVRFIRLRLAGVKASKHDRDELDKALAALGKL